MTVTYQNCPGHFIGERIWNFWTAYKAYQRKRWALPDSVKVPLKYLGFCDVYEAWLQFFQAEKMENDRAQENVARLGKMRI